MMMLMMMALTLLFTTHFPSTEFLSFVYVLSTGGTPKNIRNY